MYRGLCAKKDEPHDELCALFDESTNNGADMSQYDDLLDKVVKSISQSYRKRALGSLTSGRGGALPFETEHLTDTTDFELITWLVIKAAAV